MKGLWHNVGGMWREERQVYEPGLGLAHRKVLDRFPDEKGCTTVFSFKSGWRKGLALVLRPWIIYLGF